MRFVAVVVLAACGRVGFDARTDAVADSDDRGYFVSPTGDDANPGTRALPWLRLEDAVKRLVPGDRLTLLDGDYDAKGATGRIRVVCPNEGNSGTAAAPIVVRADHPRQARIFGAADPVEIRGCSYWEIEDLYVEGIDDPAVGFGPVVTIYNSGSNMADHITVRGLLIAHTNRHGNNSALEVGHATNVTITHCEAYDFHRSGFTDYDSSGTVFDRLYANGRDFPDIPAYSSACTGGDENFVAFDTRGTTIVNSISENACNDAIVLAAEVDGSTLGYTDGVTLANDIVLGTPMLRSAFYLYSDCDGSNSCSSEDRVVENTQIRNSVAIGYGFGFAPRGKATTIENVTALAQITGIDLGVVDVAGGLAASATVRQALVVGTPTGVSSRDQAAWSVTNSNVFGAATPYSPLDANVQVSTTVDPVLGTCKVYLPPTSPMRTAGPGGTPIGADIRELHGSPGARYWNANGTFVGCGAIRAGVNDDPATSCSGVHARLNVGVAGCPVP